ncbi:hypothetical protein DFJ74DRAFT_763061 [Hyaloraphidium curvatum]|nr:hypothetical protein DFJ74DRAFT_763061 [Hyaloraphidium curvatum]
MSDARPAKQRDARRPLAKLASALASLGIGTAPQPPAGPAPAANSPAAAAPAPAPAQLSPASPIRELGRRVQSFSFARSAPRGSSPEGGGPDDPAPPHPRFPRSLLAFGRRSSSKRSVHSGTGSMASVAGSASGVPSPGAGSSASLAHTESQHTLSPSASSKILEDLPGMLPPSDMQLLPGDPADGPAVLRRAASAPLAGIPLLPSDVAGQEFYLPSVAAKLQRRQDRHPAERAEAWDDDFAELSEGTDAEDGAPALGLKIPGEVAGRQEQVRRDAENMRLFAHHVEDLRFLHDRALQLAGPALASSDLPAAQVLRRYRRDLDLARVLLDFADSAEDETGMAEEGDQELLLELLGREGVAASVPAQVPQVKIEVLIKEEPVAGEGDDDEEEDWDAELEDTPTTAVAAPAGEDGLHPPAPASKLRDSLAMPSSATLGGPLPDGGASRLRFEVAMVPLLSERIGEVKRRLAEYCGAVEKGAGHAAAPVAFVDA